MCNCCYSSHFLPGVLRRYKFRFLLQSGFHCRSCVPKVLLFFFLGTRKIKCQERRESNMESLKSDVNMLQRKRLASEIEENLIDEEERSCLSPPSSEVTFCSQQNLYFKNKNLVGNVIV